MKIILLIFLFCSQLGTLTFLHAQSGTVLNSSFERKLSMVESLIETQMYSEAMRQLTIIEKDNALQIKSSLENEVEFRLLIARVLRLSDQFDDAMLQLNLLPKLIEESQLKLRIDFRKAALYMENPKYSMEERMEIVYPIIEESINLSLKNNDIKNLASFYNLKASMHFNECTLINLECSKNNEIAVEYFKKSMALFLESKDTLNYHNVLNSYFRLSLINFRPELDSLKRIVDQYAKGCTYFPNLTSSHFLLAQYYVQVEKDSMKFFRQTILEKNAMIDAVNKNADNTVGKLKVLYEFDSLKADIDLNREMIYQKDLMIKEKNSRITGNIIFSVLLALLTVVLIILFIRQKRLSLMLSSTNGALKASNYNYQLLIKESHHRIKNNLQMIISIIELDKEEVSVENQKVLDSISSKISTISALHKVLDFKKHNEKVKLKSYFDEIIDYFKSFSNSGIVFQTNFSDPEIESERIVYFGLILNEMISNTIKHREASGEVIIQVNKTDQFYIFTYRDNSDFKEFKKHSGVILIEDLIVRFGGENLKFDPKNGEYKFLFNE